MKYLKQFIIIISISFIGEFLKTLLPFPVPASIYGMIILFLSLLSGLIKPDMIKETAKFLIAIMPVMFIPAGVGLMTSWEMLKPVILQFGIITLVSTITVFAAAGLSSQFVIRHSQRKEDQK